MFMFSRTVLLLDMPGIQCVIQDHGLLELAGNVGTFSRGASFSDGGTEAQRVGDVAQVMQPA